MADTNYILDGLKQVLIHYLDPSELSDDLIEGLKEKEDYINSLNICVLQENIPEINELEELVANTIKSNYTSLLLDRLTEAELQNTLPTLEVSDLQPAHGSSSSSSSSSFVEDIHAGEENYTITYLSGGTYNINLFSDWTWSVISSPVGSTVQIDDGWDEPSDTDRYRSYFISFSSPGLYLLSLKISYPDINAFVQKQIYVTVI